jgi:hypothetical protein
LVAPSQPASATASAGRRQRSSPRRCPGCLPRGRASRANRWPATCRRGHRPVAGKRSANRLHTCAAPGTTSSVNHSADWIGWEAVVCGRTATATAGRPGTTSTSRTRNSRPAGARRPTAGSRSSRVRSGWRGWLATGAAPGRDRGRTTVRGEVTHGDTLQVSRPRARRVRSGCRQSATRRSRPAVSPAVSCAHGHDPSPGRAGDRRPAP